MSTSSELAPQYSDPDLEAIHYVLAYASSGRIDHNCPGPHLCPRCMATGVLQNADNVAARIDALAAERDRLREALTEIARRDHWDSRHGESQAMAYKALFPLQKDAECDVHE